ncbi:MAG: glycerophosphodiester phosphodiesterase [Ruminococcaceae bacterium]|nr:glycerophosphodiester phosphodiesterase [Oscillospiraceae bacterium]
MLKLILCLLGIIVLLFLLYVFVLVRPGRKPKNVDPALYCHYAHRGLHGGATPENSIEAFRKAAENGYGIELDIQLSADGEVMVFHDYTMERMTDHSGRLLRYTADELCKMKLKNADGETTDEKIPTLREVLSAVDGKVPLLIELKGEELDTALCPRANQLLSQYTGPYCVESFNPVHLWWYRRHRSDVLRGQLYTDVFRDKGKLPHYFLLSQMILNVFSRPHFIAINRVYKNNFCVKLVTKLYSAPHFTWTVRCEKERSDGNMIFENIKP